MARRSDRALAASWRERFSRFEASEQTAKAFCAAEGVSPASFYAWRRKLGLAKQRRLTSSEAVAAFEQVHVAPAAALSAELPGGVRLEVSSQCQQTVRTVVGELIRAARAEETSPC